MLLCLAGALGLTRPRQSETSNARGGGCSRARTILSMARATPVHLPRTICRDAALVGDRLPLRPSTSGHASTFVRRRAQHRRTRQELRGRRTSIRQALPTCSTADDVRESANGLERMRASLPVRAASSRSMKRSCCIQHSSRRSESSRRARAPPHQLRALPAGNASGAVISQTHPWSTTAKVAGSPIRRLIATASSASARRSSIETRRSSIASVTRRRAPRGVVAGG